jgi:hypothetical protein
MYYGKLYMEFIVYTVIGLWGFMVFNATFNNIFQLYRGGQFYWWRNLQYPEKTNDLQ